jgi:heme exporter protein CcmD
MSAAPHIGFVIAAYAVAALVLIGMIAVVVADHRTQQRALRRLENGRGTPP